MPVAAVGRNTAPAAAVRAPREFGAAVEFG
jgi:hypothetical protein